MPPRVHLPFLCLFSALLAASMRLQKRRKRKDRSPKKFSALRPARQDTECAFSTTPVSKSSPQGSKTRAFLGVAGNSPKASQEGPKRPPGSLPGARPPRATPRRPMCVFYRILHVKLAPALKNLRFFDGFRPPRGFQEASKRPPRGFQEASKRPPRGF